MQNKIKSILFTTLLLSASISTLTAMDPTGASSAAHQQAQEEAQLPAISYDDLMAFILPEFYSIDFRGNNIETLRQFMPAELQGAIVEFSQKMNNIGDTNKAIIKNFFTISPFEGLVRLASRQDYNGHIAGDAGEWVQLYTLHFDKAAAIAAANASADARRATDPSASSQEELLQALPDINGFMALYFPDMAENFSPEARAAEQLRLTGPNAPLALPWKGKQDNWLTHPLEHELGLNTFTDFLKMFFVPNGNAFPELRAEDKKALTDGSEVVLKLGDSVGNGIPEDVKDLLARLRGSAAFQNAYDLQSFLQKPDFRMSGNNPEIQWDEAKKQYYVEIPGYGSRGYVERAGQVIGWPAFRQYIAVDVVKASSLFTMLMKARELAKQVMSPSMNSLLNRGITDENRDVLRETLTAFLKNIKSLDLAELEKTYGRYDIFEWLKQKKETIAMRIEALGPVRAQPQAQQPRQAPQAGPAPQTQPQQGISYAMPDITNKYQGMTEVTDNSGLWGVNPNKVTDEYKKPEYENAQVLWFDGQTNGNFEHYGSIVLPEKTEVFKVKMFISSFWNQVIASLFGNLGNSKGEINNPNLKVLDISGLSSLSISNNMSWVARYLNEFQNQPFKNRTTPFIIYNHPTIKPVSEGEQVLYFDPITKKFSLMSVQTYMTQYRHKMSGTPPQAGPSQEQARANAGSASAQQVNLEKLIPYLNDDMREYITGTIKDHSTLDIGKSSFKENAFAQNTTLKNEVWNIIAQLPLKSLLIGDGIGFPNVEDQYYHPNLPPHPGIYEVPSSILSMNTLENLTIHQNYWMLFPDISKLPKLKNLQIGGDSRRETAIYMLKKNVDIFMDRMNRNKELRFLTMGSPILAKIINSLRNPGDFYGVSSFVQIYGSNKIGMYRIGE